MRPRDKDGALQLHTNCNQQPETIKAKGFDVEWHYSERGKRGILMSKHKFSMFSGIIVNEGSGDKKTSQKM